MFSVKEMMATLRSLTMEPLYHVPSASFRMKYTFLTKPTCKQDHTVKRASMHSRSKEVGMMRWSREGVQGAANERSPLPESSQTVPGKLSTGVYVASVIFSLLLLMSCFLLFYTWYYICLPSCPHERKSCFFRWMKSLFCLFFGLPDASCPGVGHG